jgi:hypothetical protein
MAKPGEKPASAGLQVRGTIDPEKYKAARALGGDQVTFELRAMKPNRGSQSEARISCIVCLICLICIVCSVVQAEEFGIPNLTPLPD